MNATSQAETRRIFDADIKTARDRTEGDVVESEHTERLRRVQQLARWMDTTFQVPGTPIRFGWDSLLGLIPGIGDAVTAATGGWIIREAHRAGAPKWIMAKMVGNVAVDMTVGVIPLVGDVFDVFWKSNLRNAKLLQRHLQDKT